MSPVCSCGLLPLCVNILLCPILLTLPFLSLLSAGSDISHVHLSINVPLIGSHVFKAFPFTKVIFLYNLFC